MTSEKIRAMVVDDDIDTVELFSEYLEIHGIEVVAKGFDGKDAVVLYEKWKPDISFIDIMMPYYDGFYAIIGIRKIDPNAKIIMVTADLTADTFNRLENLNVSITYKPFEYEDLSITIDKVIHSKPLAV
ncbi:MAG: response regulator [Thaumarchaeota archaeon]|nr:response regulator [Nitrososphaerota archaeon]